MAEIQVVTSLLNLGGITALAGILFYLHLRTLRSSEEQHSRMLETFREEISAERDRCDRNFKMLAGKIDDLLSNFRRFPP